MSSMKQILSLFYLYRLRIFYSAYSISAEFNLSRHKLRQCFSDGLSNRARGKRTRENESDIVTSEAETGQAQKIKSKAGTGLCRIR